MTTRYYAMVAACLWLLAVAPAASGELYVSPAGLDTNSGLLTAPMRTIMEAAKRARPGMTVHVLPGDYDGGFVTRANGAEGAPITYVSDVKWAAHIRPGGSAYDMAWESRGAYVVIDGFDVDGTPVPSSPGRQPWRIGIYATGSHSAIRNNHVHDIARSTACTNQGGAGVEGDSYFGGRDIDLVGNIVHDIGSENCGFVHGLYQTASGKVAGNIAYRISGWGIHLWHDARDVEIANNMVFGNGSGGILVGGGDYVHMHGPADHVTVINNLVFANSGYGIAESGDTGPHNRFAHNLCYGNRIDWRLRMDKRDICQAAGLLSW